MDNCLLVSNSDWYDVDFDSILAGLVEAPDFFLCGTDGVVFKEVILGLGAFASGVSNDADPTFP